MKDLNSKQAAIGMEALAGSTKVSVVVPVYRNEKTLKTLYGRLRTALQREASLELVFVDDCSPDASLAVLEELKRQDPAVRVVSLPVNVGQNRALLEGLRVATGSHFVTLDADLQDPPEAVPILLDKLKSGFDVVFAGRRGRYESRSRLVWSKIFKLAFYLASGRRIPADAGLFLAINEEARRFIVENAGESFYLLEVLADYPGSMVSVPIERSPNPYGESAYSFTNRLSLGIRAFLRLSLRRSSRRKKKEASGPFFLHRWSRA